MREMSRFGAGALLDFAHADDVHRHGALDRPPEGRRRDRHRLDGAGVLLELHLDEGGRCRDQILRREEGPVAERRDDEAPDAGLDPLDGEHAGRVGRGAAVSGIGDHHRGIGHRLARIAVDDTAPDRVALRSGCGGEEEQRRGERKKQANGFHTTNVVKKQCIIRYIGQRYGKLRPFSDRSCMHCVAKDAARGRLGGEPVGRSERMAWWATPTENPADDPADDPAAAQWAARTGGPDGQPGGSTGGPDASMAA